MYREIHRNPRHTSFVPVHKIIVAVAGGFDPLRAGHIEHFNYARSLGNELIVILNPDRDMHRKKGYCFQTLQERAFIIGSLKSVDKVITCIDEDGTVTRTLRALRPDIFCKGGDRTPDNMPKSEIDTCKQIGCRVVYDNLPKSDSSQQVVMRAAKTIRDKKLWQ